MVDIKDFTEKEAKGLVTLVRITDDAFAISAKKFDTNTGEELSEEVTGGNVKELTDKKAELQAEIDEIDGFIKKLNAIEPQN